MIYPNELFKKIQTMPFDPNSAKKAGKKSKRGPAKKEGPSIKEKMELLHEKVLDDLQTLQASEYGQYLLNLKVK